MDAGPTGTGGAESPGTTGTAVTLPTWIWASLSAFVAEAKGNPTKLGITYDRGSVGPVVSRLTL